MRLIKFIILFFIFLLISGCSKSVALVILPEPPGYTVLNWTYDEKTKNYYIPENQINDYLAFLELLKIYRNKFETQIYLLQDKLK